MDILLVGEAAEGGNAVANATKSSADADTRGLSNLLETHIVEETHDDSFLLGEREIVDKDFYILEQLTSDHLTFYVVVGYETPVVDDVHILIVLGDFMNL